MMVARKINPGFVIDGKGRFCDVRLWWADLLMLSLHGVCQERESHRSPVVELELKLLSHRNHDNEISPTSQSK